MTKSALSLACGLFLATTTLASAQTIYPINRAEILAGSRFDFKVEFPGAPARGAARVTINGQEPAAAFGKAATFVEKEEGGDYSALWIRNAVIAKPGGVTWAQPEMKSAASSEAVRLR